MTVKRLIQRISYYPLKFMIGLSEFINTKWYRILYSDFLKLYGMSINGLPLYVHRSARFDDFNLITLSNNCVISYGVNFLTHDYSRLIAYNVLSEKIKTKCIVNIPKEISDYLQEHPKLPFDNPKLSPIIIGENSFIGACSFILPGTVIGSNCIIGAGTVVRGIIPDGSIVIGNPGKIIASTTEMGIKWITNNIQDYA